METMQEDIDLWS